jgi:hypothetical protein
MQNSKYAPKRHYVPPHLRDYRTSNTSPDIKHSVPQTEEKDAVPQTTISPSYENNVLIWQTFAASAEKPAVKAILLETEKNLCTINDAPQSSSQQKDRKLESDLDSVQEAMKDIEMAEKCRQAEQLSSIDFDSTGK